MNDHTLPIPLRLGLTGGIGSGKSTVARMLQDMGAHVVDADAISRATTQAGGAAIEAIAKVFGTEFIAEDGGMDRAKMREHVFAHPESRARLEGIVHPLISKAIDAEVQRASTPWLVFDVPLLVESPHWRRQLDRVWVVDCSEATQISRVQMRNGWELTTVTSVIASQASRQQRLAAADSVVFNEGLSMEALRSLVLSLAAEFGL